MQSPILEDADALFNEGFTEYRHIFKKGASPGGVGTQCLQLVRCNGFADRHKERPIGN